LYLDNSLFVWRDTIFSNMTSLHLFNEYDDEYKDIIQNWSYSCAKRFVASTLKARQFAWIEEVPCVKVLLDPYSKINPLWFVHPKSGCTLVNLNCNNYAFMVKILDYSNVYYNWYNFISTSNFKNYNNFIFTSNFWKKTKNIETHFSTRQKY